MNKPEDKRHKSSPFYRFMETVAYRKTFFDPIPGNNGDRLILMGAERVFRDTGCTLVETPELAEQIIINGSGRMVNIYQVNLKKFVHYRSKYPLIPLLVGPSTFRFRGTNFREVCKIGKSPFIMFTRENVSAELLRQEDLPEHCKIHVSQDLAFELQGSEFIQNLMRSSSNKHVLMAMRKDKEGATSILARIRGTWLPKRIRRALSRIRDRIVAHSSKDIITNILSQENVSRNLPVIYRDISSSVSFEEFLAYIRDAVLIITNRLHVAILGNLLNKRVIVICEGKYHKQKIKGVYDLSMSGPGSKTTLFIRE